MNFYILHCFLCQTLYNNVFLHHRQFATFILAESPVIKDQSRVKLIFFQQRSLQKIEACKYNGSYFRR